MVWLLHQNADYQQVVKPQVAVMAMQMNWEIGIEQRRKDWVYSLFSHCISGPISGNRPANCKISI